MKFPGSGDVLLGKYLLEEQIGEGGMSVVFAARHKLLQQRVAVKFLHPRAAGADGPRPAAVKRFVREARATAVIESEHVPAVYDVGMLDGVLPYMVLELFEGTDLEELVRTRGPLPVATACDYLLQAVDAIAHAHALGIVHRDLKPANLFLARRRDGGECIKVIDFGVSKVRPGVVDDSAEITLTRMNAVLGTPYFMPPEQFADAGAVDHRCDIWSLGVIAYVLLTGKVPFEGRDAGAVFDAVMLDELRPVNDRRPAGDVPRSLDTAVLRCLRRAPCDRFPTVTDFGVAIAPFATAVGVHALENAQRVLPPAPADAALGADESGEIVTDRVRVLQSLSSLPSLVDTASTWSSNAQLGLPAASEKPPGRFPALSRRVRAATMTGVGALALLGAVTWHLTRPPLAGTDADALAAAAAASSVEPLVAARPPADLSTAAITIEASAPASVDAPRPTVAPLRAPDARDRSLHRPRVRTQSRPARSSKI